MQKEIAKVIQGYARASVLMEIERVEHLGRVTPEEARAIFQELTAGWEALSTVNVRPWT